MARRSDLAAVPMARGDMQPDDNRLFKHAIGRGREFCNDGHWLVLPEEYHPTPSWIHAEEEQGSFLYRTWTGFMLGDRRETTRFVWLPRLSGWVFRWGRIGYVMSDQVTAAGDVQINRIDPELINEISKILGSSSWTIQERPGANNEIGQYNLHLSNRLVAGFRLAYFPGCCGLVVSTGAWVDDRWRGKGLGTALNRLRLQYAKHLGYGAVICTDLMENKSQRAVLKKTGWEDVFEFTNPKTRNHLAVSVFDLTDPKTRYPEII